MDLITRSQIFNQTRFPTFSSSQCYKTFFRGSLDFPKVNKWKKVCSDVKTCTNMVKQLRYF